MQGFTILTHNMIKGTYIFYENGKEIYRSSNVITKFGKRFLTNFIAGNIPSVGKDIAVGVDNTAATVNDTRLGFEFYRTPIILSSTDIQTVDSVTTYSVVYKATIPQDISGVISEVGLYPSAKSSLNNYDSKFISDFSNFLDWVDVDGYHPEVTNENAKIGSNMLNISNSNKEYVSNIYLDLSGYSEVDTFKVAYYVPSIANSMTQMKLKFYSSDTDYFESSIPLNYSIGYHISDDINMSDILTVGEGNPDKSKIVKVGILIINGTDIIYIDGIRINDEDTFDPIYGLISRSILPDPNSNYSYLTKLSGRQVDIEYRLDLSF